MSLGAPIYALFFKSYATPGFDWWKVANVALTTVPLCGFAAIGFMGLRFWPRGRFRLVGLAAILFQTAMAMLAYASPFGFLDVTSGWVP
jgi:hypothetical protein